MRCFRFPGRENPLLMVTLSAAPPLLPGAASEVSGVSNATSLSFALGTTISGFTKRGHIWDFSYTPTPRTKLQGARPKQTGADGASGFHAGKSQLGEGVAEERNS